MKRFWCSKVGQNAKALKTTVYSKLDVRSDCKAFIQFDVDKNGVWTVTRHEKEYNHELCGSRKTHLFRSHRRVTKNLLIYLQHLKESGIPVCDGIRLLKKQSGDSLFYWFYF